MHCIEYINGVDLNLTVRLLTGVIYFVVWLNVMEGECLIALFIHHDRDYKHSVCNIKMLMFRN